MVEGGAGEPRQAMPLSRSAPADVAHHLQRKLAVAHPALLKGLQTYYRHMDIRGTCFQCDCLMLVHHSFCAYAGPLVSLHEKRHICITTVSDKHLCLACSHICRSDPMPGQAMCRSISSSVFVACSQSYLELLDFLSVCF
jgi:hypothetical protein